MRIIARPRTTARLLSLALAAAALALAATAAQAEPMPIDITDGPKSPIIASTGPIVTMNRTGYGLDTVTIAVGHTVVYYNVDTVSHVARVAPTTGVRCTDTPFEVYPREYQSCIFTIAGTYTVTDVADGASPQTVNVVPESNVLDAVSLSVDDARVRAGSVVTIAGAVNLAQEGIQVDIIASRYHSSQFVKIGQVRTGPDGSYAFVARPTHSTTYFANAIWASNVRTSATASVRVV